MGFLRIRLYYSILASLLKIMDHHICWMVMHSLSSLANTLFLCRLDGTTGKDEAESISKCHVSS